MAHKRASLDASGLVGLKVPLTPSRDHREPVELPAASMEIPAELAPAHAAITGAALAAVDAASDPLVPYPLQLRLSQVNRLRTLKKERGIVPAQLVRDFIAAGLRDLK